MVAGKNCDFCDFEPVINEHTDQKIWDALKLSHVLESFDSKDSTGSITLDYTIEENGSNVSQGQRQLVCLARALLRSPKFIVMDEATASVDPETDNKIQETIRTEFKDCTVVTVAHRLKTIIDYDRIIVLDDGNLKEMGTPAELIEQKGLFYDMCVDSGSLDELVEIAKKRQ